MKLDLILRDASWPVACGFMALALILGFRLRAVEEQSRDLKSYLGRETKLLRYCAGVPVVSVEDRKMIVAFCDESDRRLEGMEYYRKVDH